jgi:hypothetical protein
MIGAAMFKMMGAAMTKMIGAAMVQLDRRAVQLRLLRETVPTKFGPIA